MYLVIREGGTKGVEDGTQQHTIRLEARPSVTARAMLRAMFPVGDTIDRSINDVDINSSWYALPGKSGMAGSWAVAGVLVGRT